MRLALPGISSAALRKCRNGRASKDLTAALTSVPMARVSIVMAPIVGTLTDRVHPRTLTATGFAITALDPDGDGQSNHFEFTAGLIPTDPASRFTLAIAPVDGEPAQKALIFAPRLADRTYTVTFKADLTAAICWDPLA
mgnify:CR=1 FL=1